MDMFSFSFSFLNSLAEETKLSLDIKTFKKQLKNEIIKVFGKLKQLKYEIFNVFLQKLKHINIFISNIETRVPL